MLQSNESAFPLSALCGVTLERATSTTEADTFSWWRNAPWATYSKKIYLFSQVVGPSTRTILHFYAEACVSSRAIVPMLWVTFCL